MTPTLTTHHSPSPPPLTPSLTLPLTPHQVICRVLSPPVKEEMAWADEAAQKEVSKICGGLRDLDEAERAAELSKRMAEACPIASDVDLSLLTKLLSIDPTKRPTAKGCMDYAYFEELPEQMRPPISSPEIDRGQFDFEKEKLDMNDLRILIANDLFRSNEPKQGADQ